MYEVRSTSSDRPPSSKTEPGGVGGGDYDRRTPSSLKGAPAFPSDSTTADPPPPSVLLRASSSSSSGLPYQKDEAGARIRRASDPGGMDDAESVASDEPPRTKFADFRSREDLARAAAGSPSDRTNGKEKSLQFAITKEKRITWLAHNFLSHFYSQIFI